MLRRGSFLFGSAAALIAAAAEAEARKKRHVAAPAGATEVLDPGSFVDVAEFTAAPQAIDPALLAGIVGWHAPGSLPSHFTLPDLLPVTQQGTVPRPLGSPGSCEAQSFGHGLCGYTASRTFSGTKRWDQTDPANLPSAAWLYSYAHSVEKSSCPKGSGATIYVQQMIRAGAPSQQSVPYSTVCATLNPLYEKPVSDYPEAAGLRIGSYATFQIPKVDVTFLKGYLAAGHAIAFSGPVASGYSKPVLTDGVFTAAGATWSGGHGQVIVGYDDRMGGGAFLVQNSFGTQWGNGGRLWWAYDTLMQHQKLAAVAFPRATTLSGTALKSTGSGAPKGYVAGAKSVASGIVLALQFAETIALQQISISAGASNSRTLIYHSPFATGYVLIPRPRVTLGTLTVSMTGATLGGTAVTYAGAFRPS